MGPTGGLTNFTGPCRHAGSTPWKPLAIATQAGFARALSVLAKSLWMLWKPCRAMSSLRALHVFRVLYRISTVAQLALPPVVHAFVLFIAPVTLIMT